MATGDTTVPGSSDSHASGFSQTSRRARLDETHGGAPSLRALRYSQRKDHQSYAGAPTTTPHVDTLRVSVDHSETNGTSVTARIHRHAVRTRQIRILRKHAKNLKCKDVTSDVKLEPIAATEARTGELAPSFVLGTLAASAARPLGDVVRHLNRSHSGIDAISAAPAITAPTLSAPAVPTRGLGR